MMMTQRGTAGLPGIAIVAVVNVMVFGLGSAFAQPEPPIQCYTYPSSYPSQTIVVHRVGEDCKVDPYAGSTGLPLLKSWLGQSAYWEVCNKCGAPVDVKIFEAMPRRLDQTFELMRPPIDASDTSTQLNIPDNRQVRAFEAQVVSDEAAVGTSQYRVAVKFSTEGEAGWQEFDPELQIDDFGRDIDYLAWIIAALVGAAIGFGTGWWFARRRVTE